MSKAYVALGSNLQSPAQQVLRAMEELGALPHTHLVSQSSLYHSSPVGYTNQPDFINAVVALETTQPPMQLLALLQAIELQHDRQRPFPNAPRSLDLDLLLYDDLQLQSSMLTLPHPRMHTRGFVLLPLAEIAPNLRMPGDMQSRKTIAMLAAACSDQGVTKANL